MYYFFAMSGALEMYYILSPFIQFYLFRIQYVLHDKHNKIIETMNLKYNNQMLLNYEEEEEEEIALFDEDLESSLLGEEKISEQKFDTIEIE